MKAELDKEIDGLIRRSVRESDVARRQRLARDDNGDGASPHDWEASIVSVRDNRISKEFNTHLDADELSLFSENLLPAVARTRCAAHLAECVRCRNILTALRLSEQETLPTLDAFTSAALEPSAIAHEFVEADATILDHDAATLPSSVPAWRAALANMVAPRTLRFALPVLALFIVGVGIRLLSVRHNDAERAASVAVNKTIDEPAGNGQSVAQTGTTQSYGDTNGGMNSNMSSGMNANMNSNMNSNANGASVTNANTAMLVANANTATAQVPRATDESARARVETPSEVAESLAEAKNPVAVAPSRTTAGDTGAAIESLPVNGRTVGEMPPPPKSASVNAGSGTTTTPAQPRLSTPPPPAPPDSDEVLDIIAPAPRQAVTETNRERAETVEVTTEDKLRGTTIPLAPANPADRRSAPATRSAAKPEAAKEKSNNERTDGGASSPTRSVGGRAFRRQGDAWVDTAYRIPRRVVDVRRDSEQFRALVGDEPDLRRIVETLPGDVIVVWKNQAYRFH